MAQLKRFWKRKEPVTMSKLAKNTNRFVAAGIFFELMGKLRIHLAFNLTKPDFFLVLSKTGNVELVQDDNLHICDILRVKK
jgi:hypothetical protein